MMDPVLIVQILDQLRSSERWQVHLKRVIDSLAFSVMHLSYAIFIFKWKWHDIQPSMVAYTRNTCSSFTLPCARAHAHTHTHTHPHTHTHTSSGQPFMLQCLGSSLGFGALLKGTSVVVLRVEGELKFIPHTYNPCRTETQTSNLLFRSLALYHKATTFLSQLPFSCAIFILINHIT